MSGASWVFPPLSDEPVTVEGPAMTVTPVSPGRLRRDLRSVDGLLLPPGSAAVARDVLTPLFSLRAELIPYAEGALLGSSHTDSETWQISLLPDGLWLQLRPVADQPIAWSFRVGHSVSLGDRLIMALSWDGRMWNYHCLGPRASTSGAYAAPGPARAGADLWLGAGVPSFGRGALAAATPGLVLCRAGAVPAARSLGALAAWCFDAQAH